MRIGELANRTGVSRDTIRYYERSGLISSAPSTSKTNSYRHYGEDAALSLDLIAQAQAAGLTLDDVRQLIDALSIGAPEDTDALAFLDAKIGEVEATIDRSRRFLATLRASRAALMRGPDPREFNWPQKDE